MMEDEQEGQGGRETDMMIIPVQINVRLIIALSCLNLVFCEYYVDSDSVNNLLKSEKAFQSTWDLIKKKVPGTIKGTVFKSTSRQDKIQGDLNYTPLQRKASQVPRRPVAHNAYRRDTVKGVAGNTLTTKRYNNYILQIPILPVPKSRYQDRYRMVPRDKFHRNRGPYRRRYKTTTISRPRSMPDTRYDRERERYDRERERNDRDYSQYRSFRKKAMAKTGRLLHEQREQRLPVPHLISEQKSPVVLPTFNFSKYNIFDFQKPSTTQVTKKIEEPVIEPTYLLNFKNFRPNFIYDLRYQI
uniref:SFRICE_007858 n=1 Tax=Spodoptera frugiperda TaxID=7108 RepID=A0A2H1V388_SPOFR